MMNGFFFFFIHFPPADNGFNPVFQEVCEFDVTNPDMSFLRFVIQDEDVFRRAQLPGPGHLPPQGHQDR